jgi:hypothetical protein
MNPGVHAAIHAGVEEERRNSEEEEYMTNYNNEDLNDDWEFKIVRSTFGAFRKPHVLQMLIEEEAQAGWEMVEKFDENRVRFKRQTNARKRDEMLPDYVDPYRTQYGGIAKSRGLLVALGVGVAIFLAGLLMFLFVGA